MFRQTLRLLALAAIACLASAGCDNQPAQDENAKSDPGATTQNASLPDGLFAAESLAGAKSLLEVKKTAKPGDEVTFTGTIGGRGEPFVEGRAIFLVADLALPQCTTGCTTPWDLCCETPDTIAKHSATIQVVDADNHPLKTNLNGQSGLKPGVKVQVRGAVDQNAEGICVVSANAIHVLAD